MEIHPGGTRMLLSACWRGGKVGTASVGICFSEGKLRQNCRARWEWVQPGPFIRARWRWAQGGLWVQGEQKALEPPHQMLTKELPSSQLAQGLWWEVSPHGPSAQYPVAPLLPAKTSEKQADGNKLWAPSSPTTSAICCVQTPFFQRRVTDPPFSLAAKQAREISTPKSQPKPCISSIQQHLVTPFHGICAISQVLGFVPLLSLPQNPQDAPASSVCSFWGSQLGLSLC